MVGKVLNLAGIGHESVSEVPFLAGIGLFFGAYFGALWSATYLFSAIRWIGGWFLVGGGGGTDLGPKGLRARHLSSNLCDFFEILVRGDVTL